VTSPSDNSPGRRSWIGRPLRRREDAALVSGRGRYVGDVPLENCLRVAFLRSPAAAGRIGACETEAAREMPGVAAVHTGVDVAHLGALPVNRLLAHTAERPWPVLAHEMVGAVGQPVAAVLADDAQRAQDAAEAVWLDLEDPETLPAHADGRPEFGEGSPDMAESWSQGDVAAAFAAADHVVTAELEHPRLAPASLEPRTIAVDYRPDRDAVTVWLSTQAPHRARTDLAAILDIDAERIAVVAPDVGGAFGMKASLYPEDVYCVWAALAMRRAVRWSASRNEEFLAAAHGRGIRSRGRLAVAADGRFLGLEAEAVAPLGHWLPYSAAVPARNTMRILPGPYAVEAYSLSTSAIVTPTAPVSIYRGAGRPEAAALMEALVDEAAAATGLDPVEIRRRNLLTPDRLPTQRTTGATIDSGDLPKLLDLAGDAADLPEMLARRDRERQAGRIAGVGLAFYMEPSGAGWESATVTWNPDGTVTAATGSSTQGHGRVTAYAQILADLFDTDPDNVTVLVGDTRTCPPGIGALASRSTPIGGSALVAAAREVLAQTSAISRGAPVDEAVTATLRYEVPGEAWGSGCTIAAVAIDPETGVVTLERLVAADDAGLLINPMLAEGQIVGGIAQGIGEALSEAIRYDADGQLLTGSLMDYALPRAASMPEIVLAGQSTPTTVNELGAKGLGEAGTIGAPAAILSAVRDALRPFGAKTPDMPLTSEKIWRALSAAEPGDRNE